MEAGLYELQCSLAVCMTQVFQEKTMNYLTIAEIEYDIKVSVIFPNISSASVLDNILSCIPDIIALTSLSDAMFLCHHPTTMWLSL